MDDNTDSNAELATLEEPSTTMEAAPAPGPQPVPTQDNSQNAPPTPPLPLRRSLVRRLRSLLARINIYLLIFILIVLLALAIVFIAVRQSRKQNESPSVTTQSLSQDALNQLKTSDVTIGDPKQILNVGSNAIFAGTVLVRSNLEVAGQIKVGGSLSLPGITVAGISTLDQLQANSISITGSATIQKGLNVTGNGTFGGTLSASSLNINTLQLSGDLQLNRHIDAGGSGPGKSDGSALGGGGTSSVSGSDTAGTVNINTGGSTSAGCFVTVTFAQKFNDTPHVVITPIGSTAANLQYYVNRSGASFSICSANAAPATSSFSFDYIVID
ncbi:MAG TPA: hypothetical protein VLE74_03100 [Candidatus Saccharimonadales bacterium]|nr:hypothetical protein [Candidatus Saccharimonadales bacterium]